MCWCHVCIQDGNDLTLNNPWLYECNLLFYSQYSPYICIISLLTIEKKSIVFKGGCINWLGKSSFYSPTTAMWTPVQCIRNRHSFQKYGGWKWRGCWRREKKKEACIQTEGLAELMGTRRGAFLRGNHLHNGKVVGVGAESSPLVGTVSEVEGESSYQTEDQYQGARRRRCVLVICSFASCHLPISFAKQFTNNLSDTHSRCVLVSLLLKRLQQNCSVFIPLMNLAQ